MFIKSQRVEYKPLGAYATVVEDQHDTSVRIKWDDWKSHRGSIIRVLAVLLRLVE